MERSTRQLQSMKSRSSLQSGEINSANRFVPKVENHEGKEFTEKMAIIGAGPSGMSAAYYLREKGYPVTIFEKRAESRRYADERNPIFPS